MKLNMNKNCGIYKITSPTGRIYIGQSVNISRRLKSYKNLKCTDQPKLYNSFLKYGVENHQFDIIEYCYKEDLNCSERFWQDEFDVISEDNLNCSLQNCGEKRYEHSEETKKKIGDAHRGDKNFFYGKEGSMKGKKMSEESRKKLSESMKKRFEKESGYWAGKKLTESHVNKSRDTKKNNYVKEKNPNFGKPRSEETKQKIKDTKKERKINGQKTERNNIILDTQTGVFYYSIKEVSELYNINYFTLVGKLNPNSKDRNTTNFIYC